MGAGYLSIQVRCQVKTGGMYPNWNSTACTCCVTGSMLLAFMQEGFLVFEVNLEMFVNAVVRIQHGLMSEELRYLFRFSGHSEKLFSEFLDSMG